MKYIFVVIFFLNIVFAQDVDQFKLTPQQEKVFKRIELSANQGNAEAQYDLGRMYALGGVIRQDYAEAFKWFKLSAEQGNAEAQHILGVMYVNGEGARQNYAEAFKWFKLSANQGSTPN